MLEFHLKQPHVSVNNKFQTDLVNMMADVKNKNKNSLMLHEEKYNDLAGSFYVQHWFYVSHHITPGKCVHIGDVDKIVHTKGHKQSI